MQKSKRISGARLSASSNPLKLEWRAHALAEGNFLCFRSLLLDRLLLLWSGRVRLLATLLAPRNYLQPCYGSLLTSANQRMDWSSMLNDFDTISTMKGAKYLLHSDASKTKEGIQSIPLWCAYS